MVQSYSRLKFCFLLWLVFQLMLQCGQIADAAGNWSSSSMLCKKHEREALLKIKQILRTHNSSVKAVDSWVGEDCCQWQGVGCDNLTANIFLLNLIVPPPPPSRRSCSVFTNCGRTVYESYEYADAYDNIFGLIITALQGLKHLTHLELHGNFLGSRESSIHFSENIGALTQLRYLNLSSFRLAGKVPPEIGNLTNLQVLDLSLNELEGNVPPQIGNLTNLQVLDLSLNELEGNVPPQIGNLTNLQVLDLSLNELEGNVPPQIGNLTNLQVLDLSDTALEGNVPPQFGNLTNLQVLYLSNNDKLEVNNMKWASSLSNLQFLYLSWLNLSELTVNDMQILNQLPSLTHLSLFRCNLASNQLSHAFANNLSTLEYLDLSLNSLKNPLTPNIGNLSSLNYLDLSTNNFNGLIPYWLRNMKGLQFLDLGSNEFSHVENGIWGIMGNPCHFINLDLSHNQIQGQILEPPVNISKCNSYKLESLDLNNNNISGSLPSILGQLTNLKLLDLSTNKLNGDIFDIGQLTEIEHLDISSNSIQGKVSHSHLGNLSKLSYLDMSYNNLSLEIKSEWLPPFQLNTFRVASCKIIHSPQWLKTQTSIQDLDLSNTGISGKLHEWFINKSSLLRLNLSNNFLTGPLPKQFESPNLRELYINNNNVSGNIPNWLGYLENVDLSSNQLSGSIPDTFRQDCAILTLLMSNNSLTGDIPSSLKNCNYLHILDLSKNKLSGQIPPWMSDQLPSLNVLRLQENQLGEVNPVDNNGNNTTSLKFLCKLSELTILDLRNNRLSGTIPNCWGSSSSLQVINLSSNNLSGAIPCSLGNISTLEYLHLSDNKLESHIPSCLSNLKELRILNLGRNELTGAVPKWVDTSFSRLEVLSLKRNKFSGPIPKKLCNLSRLHVMDLSNNHLTGKIPSCFGNLVGMIFPVNTTSISDDDLLVSSDSMNDNKINETIAGIAREYSSNLNYLVTIDLSNNNLVGVIPMELNKLHGVVVLNLTNNSLTGMIPENIGDMKALETLDLSRNQLCGKIPASLGKIDFLSYPNFSFNNLSGPIPITGHFQTFNDPSIYAGNPYLCGDPLPKCSVHDDQPNQSNNQGDEEKKNKLEMMWFYLDVMLGFATGFWGVAGTLLLNKRFRHALFRRVEDAYDWLYVTIALKVSKLKKMMTKHDNSSE